MIRNSTISGNTDNGTLGGGGIYHNQGVGGSLTIENSTIAGNITTAAGGGIYQNAGTMTIGHSTIVGNQAAANSGGNIWAGGTINLKNTIVANPLAGGNITNSIISQGYNLFSDAAGITASTEDLVDSNTLLGPLGANGGPTETIALWADSPAINAGDNTGAPVFDQRGPGFNRISDNVIDIGAFEYTTPPFTVLEDTLLVATLSGFSVEAIVAIDAQPSHSLYFVLNSDGSFEYLPQFNYNGPDSFTYTVDGGSPITANITVTSVYDAPIANDDYFYLNQGASVTFSSVGPSDLLANDTEIEGDMLTVNVVDDPIYGTITPNGDGTVTYTPYLDFYGVDILTYRVQGVLGSANVASVFFTVLPANNFAPIFTSPDTANIDENTAAVHTVTATDDLPGQTIVFSITGGADDVEFQLIGGVLSFITAPDFEVPTDSDGNNTYIVEITADDQRGLTTTQAITVTIDPVNDNAPLFTSLDTVNIDENTTVVQTVAATDVDLPAQTIVFSITGGADGAKFHIDNGVLSFITAPDYEAPTDFDTNNTYIVEIAADDQSGSTTTQTITVTVDPVNEAPVAADVTFNIGEDQSLNGAVSFSDVDTSIENLTVTAFSGSTAHGQLDLSFDGTFTYMPNSSYFGQDSFTYIVSDGLLTDVGTVTIDIAKTPVDAKDDYYTTPSDTPLTKAVAEGLLANDTDKGRSDFFDASFSYAVLHGTLDLQKDGSFTYTPNAGFNGVDTFIYAVWDGVQYSEAMVTMVVGGGNSFDPQNDSYNTNEDTQLSVGPPGVLSNDTQLVGNNWTAHLITGPANSESFTFNADGSFQYSPNLNFNGSDLFIYYAIDGMLNTTGIVTVTITVDPVNDVPAITNGNSTFTIAENSANTTSVGTVAAIDPDVGDILTYAITSGDTSGAFVIDSSGNISVANGSLLDFETTPSYMLTVTVMDSGLLTDSGIFTVDLINVNDAPSITNGNSTFTVAENSANATAVGTVTATDHDAGDTLSYAITAGDTSGVFTIDSSGSITVADGSLLDFETTPSYTLTIEVTDGGLLTDSGIIIIDVLNLDEVAPTITSGATATAINENSGAAQVIYTVTATDTADISAGVTFSLGTLNDESLFTINSATGEVTLIGDPNFEAKSSYTFIVLASDGVNIATEKTVTLAINNLDEVAPTITSGATATAINENSGAAQVIYTVTATDTADISAGVTFSLGTLNDESLFTINSGTGEVTLIGDPDFEAKSSYTFIVLASDGVNTATEKTVTLAINNLDEVAPTITSGATATAINENSGAAQVIYTVTADGHCRHLCRRHLQLRRPQR